MNFRKYDSGREFREKICLYFCAMYVFIAYGVVVSAVGSDRARLLEYQFIDLTLRSASKLIRLFYVMYVYNDCDAMMMMMILPGPHRGSTYVTR